MNKLKISVFIIFTVLFFCTTKGMSADFKKGLAAYKRGDFAAAVREWKPFAKKGNVQIQNILGTMYQKGRGVAKDHKTAVKWFSLAAKKGFARAQYNLGAMYFDGSGVSKDYKAAVKWWRLAAKQKHMGSQYKLGLMYKFGAGVPKDYKVAIKWWKLAAKKSTTKNKQFINKEISELRKQIANQSATKDSSQATSKIDVQRERQIIQNAINIRVERARQNIKASLSAPLSSKKICSVEPTWRDQNFADLKAYFFKPKLPKSYFSIGGIGVNDENSQMCVTVVKVNPYFRKNIDKYLAPPRDWKKVWSNREDKAGALWKGVPPSVDFSCVGDVAKTGLKRPNLPEYRCVHNRFLKKFTASKLVWSDEGAEMEEDEQVTVLKLETSGSFVAVKGREESHEWYDIKGDLSAKPDPDTVEALLRKRIPKIKEAVRLEREKQRKEAIRLAKVVAAQKEAKKRAAEEAKREAEKKARIAKKRAAEKRAAVKRAAEKRAAEKRAAAKRAAERERKEREKLKNARGKWGIKFGMKINQVAKFSPNCRETAPRKKVITLECEKLILGKDRSISLNGKDTGNFWDRRFTMPGNSRVKSIGVNLSVSTREMRKKLHRILSKKYKVNHLITPLERQEYNEEGSPRSVLRNIYDNGRIVVSITRSCSKYYGPMFSRKCLTYSNYLKLIYNNDKLAATTMKKIRRSKKGEDL